HAVRFSPTPLARLELARLLIARGGFEVALPLLRALTELPDCPATARALLAQVLVERNRRRPASQREWADAEKELKLARADSGQEAPVAILQAEMLVLQGQPQAARDELDRAIARHSDQPTLYLAAIDLALAQDDEKAAATILARGERAFA